MTRSLWQHFWQFWSEQFRSGLRTQRKAYRRNPLQVELLEARWLPSGSPIPLNAPPVAADQAIITNEDVSISGQVTAVDPDNDHLTYTVDDVPTHGGNFIFSNDGTFIYAPDPDYNGPDSFTFHANDGQSDSNEGKVTILVNPVNDVPVAHNDADTVDEDGSVNTAVLANDVLGNDPAVGDQPVAVTIATGPAHGSVFVETDNTVTYTPAPNFNGSDTYQYTVTDANGDFSSATVNITVNAVNDAPSAQNGTLTTNRNTAATGTLNATDIDSPALTYSLVDTSNAHGTVNITNVNTGAFTYTPAAGYSGPASFTFKANDGSLDSNTATVNITVNATSTNTPPTLNLTPVTFTSTDITFTAVGNDADGDTLTYSLAGAPAGAAINANTGVFHWVPGNNQASSYTFNVAVSDGHNSPVTKPVTITTLGVDADGNLVVIGTARCDEIHIRARAPGSATVELNEHTTGAYHFAGHIIVYALGGNDEVDIDGNVSAEVHGGAGDDSISGGSGNDVLIGDAGDDTIEGGAGNDVLVGGGNNDRLIGGDGNDILISGTLQGMHDVVAGPSTAWDYATLRAISTAWSANLQEDADLQNNNDGDIVDGSRDKLTGGAGHDWFIISSADKITDSGKDMTKQGDVVTYV